MSLDVLCLLLGRAIHLPTGQGSSTRSCSRACQGVFAAFASAGSAKGEVWLEKGRYVRVDGGDGFGNCDSSERVDGEAMMIVARVI